MEKRRQHSLSTPSGETQIPNENADQPPILAGETSPSAGAAEYLDTQRSGKRWRRIGRALLDVLPIEVRCEVHWKTPDQQFPPTTYASFASRQEREESVMSDPTIVTFDGEEIAYSDVLVPGGNIEVDPGVSSSRIVHIPRRPTPLVARRAKAIYRLQTRKGPNKTAKNSTSAA